MNVKKWPVTFRLIQKKLSDNLGQKMDELDFEINADIFKSPSSLPFLPKFQEYFGEWLCAFGVERPKAAIIASRLPAYFTFALNSEWVENSEDYGILKNIDTPFTSAAQRERAWLTNGYNLELNVEKPVFGEHFGLRQVYIWPRAYYEEREDRDDPKLDAVDAQDRASLRAAASAKIAGKVPVRRIVVELKDNLLAWLNSDDPSDTIRVISGDAGCGKSSFCKMLAAELSLSRTRPLLVPLHLVDLEKDLSSAIQKFLEKTNTLIWNPFTEDPAFPILLILDALDELSKEGRKAEDLVKSFIDHLIREVNLARAGCKTS